MKQFQPFADSRHGLYCSYCGNSTGTRDHVPSRVLLDEPYPVQLPVVPACDHCNEGFSLDESYVACLVDCTIAGTADPALVGRSKVARILRDTPALAARLANSMRHLPEGIAFEPEHERVANEAGWD